MLRRRNNEFFVFTLKVSEGSLEIERLTDYTETLEGRLGDLDEKVQSLEERKETLEVCYFAMLAICDTSYASV